MSSKQPPRPKQSPPSDGKGVTAGAAQGGHGVTLIDHSSQAKIVCIFGKRGTGKTTLAFRLIRGKSRLLIYDPLLQFQAQHEFSRIDALSLWCLANRFREDKKKPFSVIYRPRQAREEFPYIARIAREVGSLCLLAEEISWAISPAKMDTAIEQLIRYGRHKDVELIGISRRPAEVNRDLTANANEVYIFRTHEPRDIAYFREVLGADAADSLPNLADFTPYMWRDAPGKNEKIPLGKG